MAESTDKAEVNIPNVFISDEIVEKEITYEDSTFKIKVKEIPWTKTNQIVAKCTSYSQNGQVGINLDQFYREYLVAAVMDSPWRAFTQQTMNRFTQAFGETLVAALIPNVAPGLPGGEAEEHFFEQQSGQES